MELLQLTYFCDAAITQNFSKTAEKYNVPPSNISQSIKRLEKELSAPLFDRRANRVVLNDRGQAFYDKVQQALKLLDSARAAASGQEERRQLSLVIHVNRRIVMKSVEQFQIRCPDVSILTTHDLSGAQDADLVISAHELDLRGFSQEKLFRENILLAARKGLLPPHQPTVHELRDKAYITMSAGNSLRTLTEEICRDLGFEPRIALQSEDPFYIRKCVELGLGIAFIPSVSWRDQFSADISLYRIGNYGRDVFLYRKKRCASENDAKDFCAVLSEIIQLECSPETI